MWIIHLALTGHVELNAQSVAQTVKFICVVAAVTGPKAEYHVIYADQLLLDQPWRCVFSFTS